MSEYNWQDGDQSNDQDPDLVKKLRAEIKRRDEALANKDAEFVSLKDEVRKQSVANVLRDLGVKPKVANLMPKDIEPTADAVKAWVGEWEDVFGSARIETPQATEQTERTTPAEPSIPPEQVDTWNRLQRQDASAGASVPTGDDAQMQFLTNAAKVAGDDADKYFAFLRGELSP